MAHAARKKKKHYPVSMRLPEADVAIIDRAARMRGRSRTQFVREAAVRAAEEAVMENTVIRMSPAAFKHFMEHISKPPEVVPEMLEVMKSKAPWEKRSSEIHRDTVRARKAVAGA